MTTPSTSPLWMLAVTVMTLATGNVVADDFASSFNQAPDRIWAGESYWANRLQDWRIRDHRLESVADRPLPMRTVHLLTHRLDPQQGSFDLSVRTGVLGDQPAAGSSGRGFLIGVGHGKLDYRAAAQVHGRSGPGAGLFAGVDGHGKLFIRDYEQPQAPAMGEHTVPGAVSRQGWNVLGVDSQENEAPGSYAIDGRPDTLWHTQWQATKPPHPHEIIIDMGRAEHLAGVAYLPRPSRGPGRIKNFQWFTSLDGRQWDLQAEGAYPDTLSLQKTRFTNEVSARFLKLVAGSDHLGRPVTTVAELYGLAQVKGEPVEEAGGSIAAPREIDLRVHLQPEETAYRITVSTHDPATGRALQEISQSGVPPERVVGTVALVCHPGNSETRYWYQDWRLSGSKVQAFPNDTCGPIIGTQYTLSQGVMKLTAQLMPIGDTEPREVELQVRRNGNWKTLATTEIVQPGWTASFRVAEWRDREDAPYRVRWDQRSWGGTIRRDPVDKPTIVVAGFTGNHNNSRAISGGSGAEDPPRQGNWLTDLWFPHGDLVQSIIHHQPDVLFFSGDQVYEGGSPTFADTRNIQVDYLYKWYLWCWAYRDLTRDIPTVTLPDDHDVYQGNVWGQGGRKAPKGQNSGGYVHPSEFVKMVDRTQTSHLPDPYDPTPIEQGIGACYTAMTYGRVGFAVIEDRKFKSGCEGPGLPSIRAGRSDLITGGDASVLDVPGLTLLGDRQLDFLHAFAGNWQGQDMKMCLSQTIFANLATHHGGMQWMTADMDSNGWPQTGRNKAVDALRRGFVFHLAGDQHLGSLVHHGIEQHGDANWSMCVPSIANFYPRAWAPELGRTDPYSPPTFAEFGGNRRDGFNHPVTVHAVTNPGHPMGHEPAALHDGMPGYGIVKMNKLDHTITVECWPRYADPAHDDQYTGWPMTIQLTDNYGRRAAAYLPTLDISGLEHPVVQVIDENLDEVVYTLRIQGHRFRPKVFKPGAYTIKVGDPDRDLWQTLPGLTALPPDQDQVLPISFEQAIQAFCIDFNWGPGGPNGFAAPGLWADANPAQHVAWYRNLGANVIQTFAVSCNGYAWYKSDVVPEQPGLKHDFLTEVVQLAHQEGMRVMGYFCVGANTRWGLEHPEQSYGVPADGHIPLTTDYVDFLCASIEDALTRTHIDGFMLDWFFHGPIHPGPNARLRWLPCEQQMWAELMNSPFPGTDAVTEERELMFKRRSVDRCWQRIHETAKAVDPNCKIWLSCYDMNHPQMKDSRIFREIDWLMNEAGDVKSVNQAKSRVGDHTRLLTCLAKWNQMDARSVVPAALDQGVGLYGFTKPDDATSLLPSVETFLSQPIDSFRDDALNIAVLARAYHNLPQDAVLSVEETRSLLGPD